MLCCECKYLRSTFNDAAEGNMNLVQYIVTPKPFLPVNIDFAKLMPHVANPTKLIEVSGIKKQILDHTVYGLTQEVNHP